MSLIKSHETDGAVFERLRPFPLVHAEINPVRDKQPEKCTLLNHRGTVITSKQQTAFKLNSKTNTGTLHRI